MQINFSYDSSTSSAPAGFTAALDYVAGVLDALITNPITVTIEVGWNEVGGTTLGTGNLAEGGDSPGSYVSYSQLVDYLTANAGNTAAQQELASLPADAESQVGNSLFVSTAQEKAWGIIAPATTGIDGAVGFSSAYSYSFDPNNQHAAGEYGFIGIAEHELTHALARVAGNGAFTLADYTAPGVLNTTGGHGYYSIDGGVTNLGAFAGPTQDPADWSAFNNGDAFDYVSTAGNGGSLSYTDDALLESLGFNEVNDQYLIVNESAGPAGYQNGTPYAGPVAGLTEQMILATSANINITSYVPNSFIHIDGTGTDGINVQPSGGNNVLDGSAGSDFLIGGSGTDTFYVDDRDPAQNLWSTLVNFHSGDHVTLWGVTASDFALTWLNNEGAPGATGLTGVFTKADHPEAAVTLAGYSAADLTDGKLAITFGATASQPGAPGSVYTNIQAI
jgi:hypothetical protein